MFEQRQIGTQAHLSAPTEFGVTDPATAASEHRLSTDPILEVLAGQHGPSLWDTLRLWTVLLPMAAWGWLVTLLHMAVGSANGPVKGSLGLGELCPAMRSARDNARNSLALYTVYNRFGTYGIQLPFRPLFFSASFFRCQNAAGVRNRLELVVASLVAAIEARCPQGGDLDLLSIASGSAQAVWMALRELEDRGSTRRVRVLLIDRDPGSLIHARNLAESVGYGGCLTTVEGTASRFDAICTEQGFEPAIIEMAGFLDYRNDEQATRLLADIGKALGPQGLFITCHIHPNREEPFVRWSLGWPMLYRTPDHFEALIRDSGYDMEAFVTEPHGVHSVVVAKPAFARAPFASPSSSGGQQAAGTASVTAP